MNFKDAAQLDELKALIAEADVLVENFKLGDLARYGLDYDTLRQSNPRLVYCSVTGFGHNGPYASRPGYDTMIQAMSGIMDLTGDPEGEPQKMGVAFADIFSGLYGVIGIQTALHARENTGRGQHIDIALFDCMSGVLANQAMNYLASGKVPKRMGNRHPNLCPYQTFTVADGTIMIAVGNDGQYERLCSVLGVEELGKDPRFVSNADRLANRDELETLLEAPLAERQRDELLAALEEAVVPAGPVNTVADVFADPQFQVRGMRIEPDGVPGLRTPLSFSDASLATERRSPTLGEHNEERGWRDES